MAYLMREISRERWTQDPHEISDKEQINAEVLIDLCAKNNDISTWYVGDKTDDEIKHAVLALASGFRSLDEIVIVFLDEEKIESAGMKIQSTKGETKIPEYADLHREISHLNAGSLLDIANLMLKQISNDQIKVISSEEIALWLVSSINDEKLHFKDLDKNFRRGFSGKIKKLRNKHKINFDELRSDFQEDIQEQWELNNRYTNCEFEPDCERFKQAT